MPRYILLLSVYLMASLGGCASEQKVLSADSVLVQVGEAAILVADLEAFIASLPEHLRSDKTGGEVQREYLQTLLDRELMRQEAEKRGLGDLPELQSILDIEMNKRLAQEISFELVDRNLRVNEDELMQAYEEYDLGWQVWPAHILSNNEEDAMGVIEELKNGVPFSEVAKKRSQADDAIKGGNLGAFFGEGDVVPALREATFHLDEGEFSDPIRTLDGFEVVKVLKKRRKSFAEMRNGIAKQMAKRKWNERREEVVDSLSSARNMRVEHSRVHAVLKGLFHRGLMREEAGDTLIAYDGGRMLVGDVVRGIRDLKKGALPPDSTLVFREIERWILPDSLMVLVAREEGRQNYSRIREWRAMRRVALLVNQLRVDEVSGKVEVSDTEADAYYQRHLESYKKLPGVIKMTELLVETRKEAEDVLMRVQAGESLGELAHKFSVRSNMEPIGGHVFADSGRVEIESLYQSPYRTFFGDNNDKDVGVVQGPLEVQDRYSVFRLDKPIVKDAVPFKQVQRPIRVKLIEQGETKIFASFLDSLRAAYAGQIQWDEEMLALYAQGQ